MSDREWFVEVGFILTQSSYESREWDAREKLAQETAVVGALPDPVAETVAFVLEARCAVTAAAGAEQVLAKLNAPKGTTRIVSLAARPFTGPGAAGDSFDFHPTYVGYPEICRMARTSSHYGARLTDLPRFPRPMLSSAAGNLWWRPQVQDWLDQRAALEDALRDAS